jgi:hypothetical protein
MIVLSAIHGHGWIFFTPHKKEKKRKNKGIRRVMIRTISSLALCTLASL